MLGLGLASSHAPAMFAPQEMWSVVYDRERLERNDGEALEDVVSGYNHV